MVFYIKIKEWIQFYKIKFLKGQVAIKDTFFHEEIKFPRQQLETALSKQENSSIGFYRNGQHIRSNIVNSDDSS